MTKKRIKLKGKINKIVLIISSIAIFVLLFFVIASKIYLSPVDKKDDKYVTFKVENGWGKNQIADHLEEAGLIKNAFFFKVYVKLNINKELYAGTYQISKSMTVNEIIDLLNSSNSLENETVTITFIEGKRLTDYAKQMANTFGFKEEDVLNKAKDETFLNKEIKTYSFLSDKILDSKIYYPLEGYLFPDTYNFKKNVTIEEIYDAMLKNMGDKLSNYKDDFKVSSYSVHELLTLASIIELEGSNGSDRPKVAGVFYNRLNAGMALGSDATTYYGANKDFSKDLTQKEIDTCNAYNTRSSCLSGLPVGPIDSPSLSSIAAAIEPEKNDYYYFGADKNKKTYFSKTNAEH